MKNEDTNEDRDNVVEPDAVISPKRSMFARFRDRIKRLVAFITLGYRKPITGDETDGPVKVWLSRTLLITALLVVMMSVATVFITVELIKLVAWIVGMTAVAVVALGPNGRRALWTSLAYTERKVQSGLTKALVVILATIVVLLVAGLAFERADDDEAVTAFYDIHGDGYGGRTIANTMYDADVKKYGPVKVARLDGGTAFSYWGKWIVLDPADKAEERTMVKERKPIGSGLL